MPRYLVTSYTPDQQWHYDVVEAEDNWGATSRVCELRPEVIDANAVEVTSMSLMMGAK